MDDKDAISHLPDEVIGRILSSLSTKQAASTSVLAKRWRNVFPLIFNLDIDDRGGDSVVKPKRKRRNIPQHFMDFIDRLLNLQGDSYVKSFTLKTSVGVRGGVDPNRVNYWIRNVLERGVVVLDLSINFRGKSQPVPSSIFKSKTLVNLRLGCGFIVKVPPDVSLPMLRTLSIDSVDFDGDLDVIETFLSRCPVLEEFAIQGAPWSSSISSPSLKRLHIRFDQKLTRISIDTPNLVYFKHSGCVSRKYPNAKFDSLVEARLNLRVDDTRMQGIRNGSYHCIPIGMINLINGIRNVKVLHLSGDALELLYFTCQEMPLFDSLIRLSIESDKKRGWQILPILIKNSPNLETLIFMGLDHDITEQCGDACVCYFSEENTISCLLSSRVKVLEILGYQGTTRELNQIKHFLAKLPCLELVKICAAKHWNNFQVTIDMRNLMMLPRASSKCKIQVMFFNK